LEKANKTLPCITDLHKLMLKGSNDISFKVNIQLVLSKIERF